MFYIYCNIRLNKERFYGLRNITSKLLFVYQLKKTIFEFNSSNRFVGKVAVTIGSKHRSMLLVLSLNK